MRREEDRPAGRPQLVEDLVEGPLHERVEALRRLVQDRQLGVVLQRLHDAELLAHPPAVVADRAGEIAGGQLEAVDHARAPARRPAVEGSEVVEELRAGHRVVQRDAAGQVADAAADGHAVRLRVEAEDAGAAGRVGCRNPRRSRMQVALAGPVGAQEPEDLARPDREVDVVEGRDRPAAVPRQPGPEAPGEIVLREPARLDDAHGPEATPPDARRSGSGMIAGDDTGARAPPPARDRGAAADARRGPRRGRGRGPARPRRGQHLPAADVADLLGDLPPERVPRDQRDPHRRLAAPGRLRPLRRGRA